jgi:hypothetical protein
MLRQNNFRDHQTLSKNIERDESVSALKLQFEIPIFVSFVNEVSGLFASNMCITNRCMYIKSVKKKKRINWHFYFNS